MRKTSIRKITSLFLSLVFACLFTGSLSAADPVQVPDLTAQGSVRLNMEADTPDGPVPVGGGKLSLYMVASVGFRNGHMTYELTADFSGSGADLSVLGDEELAVTLRDYALSRDLDHRSESADESGRALFGALETGLYLINQSETPAGYFPIKPFLVSLPLAEDGKWVYDVDASPKMGFYSSVPTSSSTVPEVTPTPTPPLASDTTEPEGSETTVSETVPNESSTAETSVPEESSTTTGPSSETTPAGTTAGPSASVTGTQPPKLPQTGQLQWPIPVLAVLGIILFTIGWILYFGRKNRHDEP